MSLSNTDAAHMQTAPPFSPVLRVYYITHLVVQKDSGPWLQLVLVDKGEDGNVVLGAGRSADNGMVIIDNLFQVAYAHGRATQVLNLRALLLKRQQRREIEPGK